jgi:hypothetical protein
VWSAGFALIGGAAAGMPETGGVALEANAMSNRPTIARLLDNGLSKT